MIYYRSVRSGRDEDIGLRERNSVINCYGRIRIYDSMDTNQSTLFVLTPPDSRPHYQRQLNFEEPEDNISSDFVEQTETLIPIAFPIRLDVPQVSYYVSI